MIISLRSYTQVGWQVYRTTSEEKRIKSRRDAEISAGAAAQATIQKEQVRVTTLQEQLEAHAEVRNLCYYLQFIQMPRIMKQERYV